MDITAVILIFLVALIAGYFPFAHKISNKKLNFQIGEALAAGVFLGAGLLHMLSDSADQFMKLNFNYPWAFLLAGITFLFLLLLEHAGREVYEHGGGEGGAGFAVLACLMLSIHSFLAGVALGLADSTSMFILVLVAILAHKWAASFALSVQITKTSMPIKSGLVLFVIFALMTPLGVFVGSSIEHIDMSQALLVQPIFTALAAGTFLYLGTLHGLSRSIMVNRCCGLRNYLFVLLGFAIMAVVAIWT